MRNPQPVSLEERHMPAESGVWLFVFGDMMVFSMFFLTYLYYRGKDVALFVDSQIRLNQTIGVLNTFLMLTSSWFVATAVHAARRREGAGRPLGFILAIGCGLAFVVVKLFEYGEKIRSGITLTTNAFYMFYYMLTGIHLIHVLIGISALTFVFRFTQSRPPGP